MSSQPEQLLRPVVGPVVERLGYDFEGLTVSVAGRRHVVRVVVDRDGGFGLDDMADISRALSTALEDDDSIPGSYVLEVSSPGVDRPLVEARHWRRNVGRLVAVTLSGNEEINGRIRTAEETGATLVDDATGVERTVAYADVGRALVQVELRRKREEVGTDVDGDVGPDETPDGGEV